MQVLDSQYKYGRYFFKSRFYLSLREIIFSVLLTANEDVKQKL